MSVRFLESIALGCSLLALVSVPASALDFAATEQQDRLVITQAGKPVAHFVFKDAKILRPYFSHVHTPDGIQVTRTHPPVAGKDAVDHDTMHPGVWLAFGDVSGNDFWRNKAVVRHERFTAAPSVKAGQLTFATETSLLATNATKLATLASRFTVSRAGEGFLLTWEASFTATTDGFVFGDQEEMGFGVRVATELTEKKGGVIISSSGATTAKGTWGKTADWCDYSGVLGERRVGIAVLADPQNFRASWFHNRDYGLMVANPFGENAFTKGAKSRVPVAKGETFRLRFGAWIHSSAKDGLADVAGVWEMFRKP
ncbi:MAG: hypothetical protein FD161_2254 [Limisphaerales bacterium]|nr:MAG: hypothetical protein FD161_2254 [Limisphaerales bacterium]KAG0508766.1 MAG: hypothetical protein E1N63_2056 [Limisphaerales bacterium]TXT50543.1 MAG: hypothetical protein FD140_2327 [Limisphaerales bacterium]